MWCSHLRNLLSNDNEHCSCVCVGCIILENVIYFYWLTKCEHSPNIPSAKTILFVNRNKINICFLHFNWIRIKSSNRLWTVKTKRAIIDHINWHQAHTQNPIHKQISNHQKTVNISNIICECICWKSNIVDNKSAIADFGGFSAGCCFFAAITFTVYSYFNWWNLPNRQMKIVLNVFDCISEPIQ